MTRAPVSLSLYSFTSSATSRTRPIGPLLAGCGAADSAANERAKLRQTGAAARPLRNARRGNGRRRVKFGSEFMDYEGESKIPGHPERSEGSSGTFAS